MKDLPTVVGLGEILWDLLPGGRQLGGAPANFAYCSHLLGNRGVVASRVGTDELGDEVRRRLLGSGLTDQFLQVDPDHPTGTVPVEVDADGIPRFEITYPAAWDFLQWTDVWHALSQSADAVCFGSLAQRSPPSRETILRFLDAVRPDALRIFDVNLRQSFYSEEVIAESMTRAHIAKLNHDEAPKIAALVRMEASESVDFCRELIRKFGLQMVCVTRGAHGSLLVDQEAAHEHPGFGVQVKDTVGSGDAFTAGLVHQRLRGASLAGMNDLANRMGAWVASCAGAMPSAPIEGLKLELERLERK